MKAWWLGLGLGLAPLCQAQVAFDRPGLGMSPAALPFGGAAVELGLPDRQWAPDGNSRVYEGTLRVGLGHHLELQYATADGTSLALKYARPLANGANVGMLLSTGQGTHWGMAYAQPLGAVTLTPYLQIGRGYEASCNASYALANLSPYIELGYLHDGFLGHSSALGAGLAGMLTPDLQWDLETRYLPALRTWQAGWGLSFAF